MADEEEESGDVLAGINNLRIETAGTEEEEAEHLEAAWGWRLRWTGGAKEKTREGGLKGHWEPLSSSLSKLSQAELRSLMPVMGSTS